MADKVFTSPPGKVSLWSVNSPWPPTLHHRLGWLVRLVTKQDRIITKAKPVTQPRSVGVQALLLPYSRHVRGQKSVSLATKLSHAHRPVGTFAAENCPSDGG